MKESLETPVVDVMGKTKAVLQHVADHWEMTKKAGNDRYIKDEKEFWPWLIQQIKDEFKVTNEDLLFSGVPASVVVESMTEADAAPAKVTETPYTEIHLKKKDGTVTKVAFKDVAAKIKPYTKNFASPDEALIKGKPDQILKVIQSVFGADVVQWTAPVVKKEAMPLKLTALMVAELFNQDMFDTKSVMFDSKDGVRAISNEFIRGLCDAFDKDKRDYLVNLFPNVDHGHLALIIQEAKTVLDEIGAEQVNKLFPNIDKSYLVNAKEDSSTTETPVATESAVGLQAALTEAYVPRGVQGS